MAIIKKVLNTSVVLVDDNQQEKIVLGKGIGFGKKVGDPIESNVVTQTYLPVNTPQAEYLLHLIDNISNDYFEVSTEIIQYGQTFFNEPLQPLLYLSLTDHIHFAMERHRNGIVLSNRVFWEVKTYYPTEFNIGEFALKKIEEKLNEMLPEEEAANIAFHFINSRQKSDKSDALKSAKMIGNIVNLIKYTIGVSLNETSVHYQRFITHIRFFVERYMTNQMIEEDDMNLFNQMTQLYPEAMTEAIKVQDYIKQKYHRVISVDEVSYLAMHINRLMKEEK